MKKIIFYLFFFLTALLFNSAIAVTYYISNSGNDNNSGFSPGYSWNTISKLNSMMTKLKPGDEVLFERDGYFTGQINLTASGDESNPLIFGAYGEGKNPVISGAVPVNGWKKYTDEIFETEVDTAIKNLFAEGNQMTLARYPNTGYLKIKQSLAQPTTGFLDGELIHEDGYWNGANLRVRSINWAYEHSVIKNYINKSITLTNETTYPLLAGWGYYFDNKFSELDHEMEWYYQENDTSGGKLYYYPPADIDPASIFIEASFCSYGFYSAVNLSNVMISDLEIKNQTISGINFLMNKDNIKIFNCTFRGQLECGIELQTLSRNCEVTNCRFYNINGKAIYMINSVNSFISNNIFENTGMNPGYGTTNDAFGMSAIIVLVSDSNHITKNYINNTGHDGINCIGYSNRIEKNIITNSLLFLNDGAAIKSYGKINGGTIWNNNFIQNVKGNLEATPERENYIASVGAYLDAYCNEMKIIDNTILNCGLASINLYYECMNNYIKGNICLNSPNGIFFYKGDTPMEGNTVTENIFYGETEYQISVKLKAPSPGFIPGKFEKNYYCNPKNYKLFIYESGRSRIDYDFNEWKNLMNASDVNSKSIVGIEALYPRLFTNMSDDSLTIVLNHLFNYKDINLKSVNGSMILQPWSSKILFANSDISKLPDISVAGGPLNFENTPEGNSSVSYWYNLTGENLQNPVLITASDGFEVSLNDDVNFSKTFSINPVNGKVDKIIFVKFKPNEKKSFYDFITITSGYLKSVVKVTGSS